MLAADGAALDDPLLEESAAVLAEKPHTIQPALLKLGSKMRSRITDRLVDRGLVRKEKKQFLGIIPSTIWPAEDVQHEEQLRGTILRVLTGSEQPDDRTAALISLLTASRQLHTVMKFDGIPRKQIDQRAKEIAEGSWSAGALNEAIRAANIAIIASTASAVSTAVVIASTSGQA